MTHFHVSSARVDRRTCPFPFSDCAADAAGTFSAVQRVLNTEVARLHAARDLKLLSNFRELEGLAMAAHSLPGPASVQQRVGDREDAAVSRLRPVPLPFPWAAVASPREKKKKRAMARVRDLVSRAWSANYCGSPSLPHS